jgi:hypothetical protein
MVLMAEPNRKQSALPGAEDTPTHADYAIANVAPQMAANTTRTVNKNEANLSSRSIRKVVALLA